MNENIITYTFSVGDPTEGNALGANALYFMIPFGATLIYMSGAPYENDADATITLNDDASGVVSLACVDKDVPGEWISTHSGGTETPVEIAAGSVMDFTFVDAAAANRFDVVLNFLQGSTWG